VEPVPKHLNLLDELGVQPEADLDPRRILDRAAGMLAGRVGCTIREAQIHLLRMAEEQRRDPAGVASEVLAVLEMPAIAGGTGQIRGAVENALTGYRVPILDTPVAESGGAPLPFGPDSIRDILDALPGAYSWLVPVRDGAGEVVDFRTGAASPEAVDLAGRQGSQLVGVRVTNAYPSIVGGPIWQAYLQVLADGKPRQVGPYTHTELGDDAESVYSIRVHRLGPGLLVGWIRHDELARPSDRLARTERLASLGWAEWDLVTDQTVWSEELYRIYERDPADGPLSDDEISAMVLPEDEPLRERAAALFGAGQATDVTYRMRVGGRIKHVRAVVDAVRDVTGQPLKVYGILQDVTTRETTRARLADVEQQLREHQQTLAAEHRMAAQLQQIILPMPAEPIDLPGLRVAVRYLPAERSSRVGGDWFHADRLADGGVLLAVGDVAGHGIQAATTMARLRHALAALAVTTTTDPAALLGHLNHLLLAGGEGTDTATAVVARYDPADQRLTWAQAGHPAPLRTRGGVTTELARPRGPLLGVLSDVVYERTTITLEVGDVLLLYTDGLVENRHQPIAEGLAPVVDTLNRITAQRSPQPLADLLAQLRRANPDDDTCILAARPLVDQAPDHLLNLPFELDTLVSVRHAVADRCAAAGLVDGPLYWFVVAVNEITTNAVRHGGGSGQLTLWLDRGLLYCRVVDHGPGFPADRHSVDIRPEPDALGGRGLWLARQGSATVTVETGPDGSRVTLSQPVPPAQVPSDSSSNLNSSDSGVASGNSRR